MPWQHRHDFEYDIKKITTRGNPQLLALQTYIGERGPTIKTTIFTHIDHRPFSNFHRMKNNADATKTGLIFKKFSKTL